MKLLNSIFAALTLSCLPASAGVAFLYTSNWENPGGATLGYETGIAFSFRTGPEATYSSDILLKANNVPVGMYSGGVHADAGGAPGALLVDYFATRSEGPDPATLTFLSTDESFIYQPNTTYFFVTSDVGFAESAFLISPTSEGYVAVDDNGWSYPNSALYNDGEGWITLTGFYFASLVEAEAVPEPSLSVSVAVGAALLALRKRRTRSKVF